MIYENCPQIFCLLKLMDIFCLNQIHRSPIDGNINRWEECLQLPIQALMKRRNKSRFPILFIFIVIECRIWFSFRKPVIGVPCRTLVSSLIKKELQTQINLYVQLGYHKHWNSSDHIHAWLSTINKTLIAKVSGILRLYVFIQIHYDQPLTSKYSILVTLYEIYVLNYALDQLIEMTGLLHNPMFMSYSHLRYCHIQLGIIWIRLNMCCIILHSVGGAA